MLTTSSSSTDVLNAYENGANSYLKKPEGSHEIEQFKKAICLFWSSILTLSLGNVSLSFSPSIGKNGTIGRS